MREICAPLNPNPGEDGAGAEAVAQPLAQPPGGRRGAQGARDVTPTAMEAVSAERTERRIVALIFFVVLHTG